MLLSLFLFAAMLTSVTSQATDPMLGLPLEQRIHISQFGDGKPVYTERWTYFTTVFARDGPGNWMRLYRGSTNQLAYFKPVLKVWNCTQASSANTYCNRWDTFEESADKRSTGYCQCRMPEPSAGRFYCQKWHCEKTDKLRFPDCYTSGGYIYCTYHSLTKYIEWECLVPAANGRFCLQWDGLLTSPDEEYQPDDHKLHTCVATGGVNPAIEQYNPLNIDANDERDFHYDVIRRTPFSSGYDNAPTSNDTMCTQWGLRAEQATERGKSVCNCDELAPGLNGTWRPAGWCSKYTCNDYIYALEPEYRIYFIYGMIYAGIGLVGLLLALPVQARSGRGKGQRTCGACCGSMAGFIANMALLLQVALSWIGSIAYAAMEEHWNPTHAGPGRPQVELFRRLIWSFGVAPLCVICMCITKRVSAMGSEPCAVVGLGMALWIPTLVAATVSCGLLGTVVAAGVGAAAVLAVFLTAVISACCHACSAAHNQHLNAAQLQNQYAYPSAEAPVTISMTDRPSYPAAPPGGSASGNTYNPYTVAPVVQPAAYSMTDRPSYPSAPIGGSASGNTYNPFMVAPVAQPAAYRGGYAAPSVPTATRSVAAPAMLYGRDNTAIGIPVNGSGSQLYHAASPLLHSVEPRTQPVPNTSRAHYAPRDADGSDEFHDALSHYG